MTPKSTAARSASAQDGAAASAAAQAQRMQQAIVARARHYTLGALADALTYLGYQEDDVELLSHATATHQSSLITEVRFAEPPRRRVTVVINLGLLAPQSPIPSYFQQVLHSQTGSPMADFLNFFSHRLLLGSVQAQFPERSNELFPSWQRTLADVRSLLGLRTPYAIHWVFKQIYPELGVSIQRMTMARTVYGRTARLGPWSVGDGSTLGGVTQVPVGGIGVRLLSDEALSGTGVLWPKEAAERLQRQVFPLLRGNGIFLHVQLNLRDQRNYMVLRPKEYLGYAPLYSGPRALPAPRSVRTIILWDDEVPASST